MNQIIEGKDYNKIKIALFQIKQLIIEKLEELGLSVDLLNKIKSENIFDIPSDSVHGDYTTNVAMMCAKELKMSPINLAESLTLALSKGEGKNAQFEIAGPGFINIRLSDEISRDAFNYVGQVDNREENKFFQKNVLVEHSSPNLFKPLHVGHLMNNFIGEVTYRLLKQYRANVRSMSFPSDQSLGIAKAVYIIVNIDKKNSKDIMMSLYENLQSSMNYFSDAYVRGVKYYEDNVETQNKIKELSSLLYDNKFESSSPFGPDISEEIKVYNVAKDINYKYFVNVISSLNSIWTEEAIFESQASVVGKNIIIENLKVKVDDTEKVFQRSEGAIVYKPDESRKDIHTAVFINSQGHPTYEGKDIGLMKMKFMERADGYKPDYSFTVTDAEQISHFKVVFDAALAIAKYNEDHSRDISEYGDWREWVKSSHHIPHGRMMFKGQKMSSRLGGVPLALDVIDVVKEEARKILNDNNKLEGQSEIEKDKIAFEIAMSALRIAVLRAKPGININFDPDTSLSFEGDSGPYLLYTYARCSSLIDKGWERFGSDTDKESFIKELDFNKNKTINELESNLLHYNDALISCVKFDNGEVSVEPQKLVSYLFKVAREFNSFYGNIQIISDDKMLTKHNLKIVLWTKEVMKHGLHILGIEAQERM